MASPFTSFKNSLKKIKPVYWVYNLFHYKELQHNRSALKKYKINKSLFGTLSSKDFPDKESKAWLDTGDSAVLAPQKETFKNFTKGIQQKIIDWSANGYMILENFLPVKTCDAINEEIDTLLNTKRIQFTNGNKLMFANKKSGLVKEITFKKELTDILSFLLDTEVVPFQTINFITGSQQRAHSDSIHMTTYPLGYLIAVWIALEDINENNGPLFYYPGSHKLPYLLNDDFNEGENFLLLGKKNYTDYEDVLEALVKKKQYAAKEFYAKKGNVFIWHANLVHGGAPIINKGSTRKSMVIHYYAKDVIKYHEITERPSLLSH
jgi:ectoine hydroxylase